MAIYHANKMLNYMKKTHIEEKEHSEQKSIHALSKKKKIMVIGWIGIIRDCNKRKKEKHQRNTVL